VCKDFSDHEKKARTHRDRDTFTLQSKHSFRSLKNPLSHFPLNRLTGM
jgi:hypothetical protein